MIPEDLSRTVTLGSLWPSSPLAPQGALVMAQFLENGECMAVLGVWGRCGADFKEEKQVVVKMMVPFWVLYILGAVLHTGPKKGPPF